MLLAIGQVGDPAFRRPVLIGAVLALLGGVALIGLTGWAVNWLAGGEGWIATAAATAGGLLALLAAWWLFVPLLLAIASILTDGVAAAVEQRHYPGLPPPRGASTAAQAWSGLLLALRLALVTLVLLPLLLLPPFGAVALWAVAAVGLGEGLFLGVAQRRMSVAESEALKRRLRVPIWMLGGVLALAGIVAPLNLLVPVVGTAAMVHLLQRRNV
ncbi:EI24 domain-containing protein [Falsiroseomonas oryziterrae]|uniref:EI24 domain-containing protein n=1 Tax=Falsiroseomonas oryziterrae TaxID=2911368 RepID=UPI001F437CCB|nr:EI24 domain-containing protein [Roseomonas sp. NPKOSM-4]